MPSYPVHTIEAAPAAYGVEPNLLAVLSSAPPVLEVVLGIAFKILSNDANHLTGTPLDPMVEPTRWSAGDGVADD